jgi:broad specificity phosphatase PhoE
MRLFVVARHGESTLNHENRLNGDPTVRVALTQTGREEAHVLGQQLAQLPVDVCLHSRFGRTRETAEIALAGREVPLVAEPLLDDIDVGELEGKSLDEYRAWKRSHTRAEAFPGGESLDAAARRYAQAFRAVLDRPERTFLIVTHEIPLRYAINAAAGSANLDAPTRQLANGTPYLFDQPALERAVAQIERLTS